MATMTVSERYEAGRGVDSRLPRSFNVPISAFSPAHPGVRSLPERV